MTTKTLIVDTPVGKLLLEAAEGRLVSCAFLREDNVALEEDKTGIQEGKSSQPAELAANLAANLAPPLQENALLKRAAIQIDDYFSGKSTTFDLPIGPANNQTPFREKVWRAMREIPYGTTTTYGELARKLSTSPRAMGGACRSNPLILITPCHRVVARGGIGGFSGEWKTGLNVEIKKNLLALESA